MLEIGCAILFAVFLWWASTGAILFLDGLPRRTYVISMAAMTALAAGALAALWWTRDDAGSVPVIVAFTAALTLWGWNEMAFLMGFITGPRRAPATPGLRGWPRFGQATATIISHEIAIALTALLIWALTVGGANSFGFWTFAVLWIMRLSTKINIFLGAPNITDEFLPPHLAYLSSYFRRRPMNGFFPLSVTLGTLATAGLVHHAFTSGLPAGELVGFSLLAALMALAVLEHWLLFVPVPAARLWSWSLRSHGDAVAVLTARVDAPSQSQPPMRSNG